MYIFKNCHGLYFLIQIHNVKQPLGSLNKAKKLNIAVSMQTECIVFLPLHRWTIWPVICLLW